MPVAQLAASKLAEAHYDAAVTDLSMPELDGFGVLSHALDARPCTPIIFITGKKELELTERAFRQGGFALKPPRLISMSAFGWSASRPKC
jgi:CheY-like chemotaxis protein